VKSRAKIALLALAAAVGIAVPVHAQPQTGTITGTVTNRATGEPVAGVMVSVQGTRISQITNDAGRYLMLNVPAGSHAVIAQNLGYTDFREFNVRVTAGETTTLNIALAHSVLTLEEVVVSGTSEGVSGLRTPFSVGRVSRENIATVPTTGSAVTAIQGKVAGVSMIRGSGLPGSGTNIVLRTPTSIQGSGSPMIVVDGVILSSSIGNTTVDLEALDIESVEVVKGAAAASLYGSRAANGVISITTNRGRNISIDQTRITVRSELGVTEQPKPIKLTNSHQFLQNDRGEWVDRNGNVVTRNNRVLAFGNIGMLDQPYRTPVYDNVSEFFRPTQFNQNQVNLSHRAASTNFLASATRYLERGTLETNEGFVRDNFRLNLDHRLRSDFSLGVSATHSRYDRDLIYQGSAATASGGLGGGGIFWDLLMFDRDVNVGARDSTGQFVQQPDPTVALQNPLWYEASREYWEKRARTLASVNASYHPFGWLTMRGDLAYDRSDRNLHAYTPRGTPTSLDGLQESNGFLQKDNEVGNTLNASFQGNITWNFGLLSTRTLARALIERESVEFLRATGSNFHVPDVPRLNVAADRTVSSLLEDIRATGYFIEETLDYADKYYLTGMLRRDGSSLFGENERWHNYYRVGGSWRMSEESWWRFEPLSEFKLRYAIGTAGSRPQFDYQYETWNVANSGAVTKGTLGNRNLRPEHTTEQDMGIDMIINNRYSLQLTYAHQRTDGQIIQFVLPAYYGYSSQRRNTGVQSGTTYEATLEASVVARPHFTWSMTAIADRSRGRIDEWNRACFTSVLRNVCEGASVQDMWGYRHLRSAAEIAAIHPNAASQFQVNDEGYVVWVGAGGDYRQGLAQNLWGTSGSVDGRTYQWGLPIVELDEDGFQKYQVIGTSAPDVNLGWLNNIYYRGFAIHTHTHAQLGGNVYNQTRQRLYQHYRHGDLDQAGKPDELKKPLIYSNRLYNVNNVTQHFVEDGSYLKLRAVSLMYRFNQDQLSRWRLGGAHGINLGVNMRNVLTLSRYSGFDPEVGSVNQRLDAFAYPNSRQITFTGEITF
jgi:TonB-linked SusC/RagA family outer membrane protein